MRRGGFSGRWGCQLYFEKGGEFCPLKDDRDVLIEKIMAKNAFLHKISILNADSILSDVY